MTHMTHHSTHLPHAPSLVITNLAATVKGVQVLDGLSLEVRPGQIVAVMGPNGAGKSSLCNVIAGHPFYKVTKGHISLGNKDVMMLAPDERGRAGIFLAFQHPLDVQGVHFGAFLLQIYRQRFPDKSVSDFYEALDKSLAVLHLDRSFTERQLNVGFSGGERKRAEVLQMLMLQPTIALLDETDSGLDIDSLAIVAKAIDALVKQGAGVLIVTHYNRIFEQVKPDVVHVMLKGKIAMSGDANLVKELEHKGYGWLKPGALKVV